MVSGVDKRHGQEWEDGDRRLGVRQGDEGRAVKFPYMLLCGDLGRSRSLCLWEGDSGCTGGCLEALVLLVCCGSDGNFGKGSKLPGCSQGRNIP